MEQHYNNEQHISQYDGFINGRKVATQKPVLAVMTGEHSWLGESINPIPFPTRVDSDVKTIDYSPNTVSPQDLFIQRSNIGSFQQPAGIGDRITSGRHPNRNSGISFNSNLSVDDLSLWTSQDQSPTYLNSPQFTTFHSNISDQSDRSSIISASIHTSPFLENDLSPQIPAIIGTEDVEAAFAALGETEDDVASFMHGQSMIGNNLLPPSYHSTHIAPPQIPNSLLPLEQSHVSSQMPVQGAAPIYFNGNELQVPNETNNCVTDTVDINIIPSTPPEEKKMESYFEMQQSSGIIGELHPIDSSASNIALLSTGNEISYPKPTYVTSTQVPITNRYRSNSDSSTYTDQMPIFVPYDRVSRKNKSDLRGRSSSSGSSNGKRLSTSKSQERYKNSSSAQTLLKVEKPRPKHHHAYSENYITQSADTSHSASDTSESSHKPIARYKCEWEGCERRFTRKFNRDNHMITHTGKRPFECEECGFKFTRQNDLNRHRALHTGERAYICAGYLSTGEPWGCQKTFARRDALGRHFKSEAGRNCVRAIIADKGMHVNASASMSSAAKFRHWLQELGLFDN